MTMDGRTTTDHEYPISSRTSKAQSKLIRNMETIVFMRPIILIQTLVP